MGAKILNKKKGRRELSKPGAPFKNSAKYLQFSLRVIA
jgi:hypothetical protein